MIDLRKCKESTPHWYPKEQKQKAQKPYGPYIMLNAPMLQPNVPAEWRHNALATTKLTQWRAEDIPQWIIRTGDGSTSKVRLKYA